MIGALIESAELGAIVLTVNLRVGSTETYCPYRRPLPPRITLARAINAAPHWNIRPRLQVLRILEKTCAGRGWGERIHQVYCY